ATGSRATAPTIAGRIAREAGRGQDGRVRGRDGAPGRQHNLTDRPSNRFRRRHYRRYERARVSGLVHGSVGVRQPLVTAGAGGVLGGVRSGLVRVGCRGVVATVVAVLSVLSRLGLWCLVCLGRFRVVGSLGRVVSAFAFAVVFGGLAGDVDGDAAGDG